MDGLTHTKQLLNLLCIVYIQWTFITSQDQTLYKNYIGLQSVYIQIITAYRSTLHSLLFDAQNGDFLRKNDFGPHCQSSVPNEGTR